jgi:hypothetical protein
LLFLRGLPARREVHSDGNDALLGRVMTSSIIEVGILLLMVSISTSKVFSPQFLLWLVPLLPLMSIEGRSTKSVWLLLVLTCAAGMLLFPQRFESDIVGTVWFSEKGVLASGPTRLGVSLLVLRNTLFVAATILMFRRTSRAGRRALG